MSLRIEDYGLVGDTHTVAVIGTDGSVDWLCLPRLDSDACFAALLGGAEHGRWALGPAGGFRLLGRRYRGESLVLETELANDQGVVRLVDFMPLRGDDYPTLVRRVEGVSGRVEMDSELRLRFDYGLDSALLLIPAVGFLPADDKRVRGTIKAIEKHLCDGGFVQRYTMDAETEAVDGLPPGEASFLMCSFWLADAYVLQGRVAKADVSTSSCSTCATTSACSPRSTTSGPAHSSATCRRPTPTSA